MTAMGCLSVAGYRQSADRIRRVRLGGGRMGDKRVSTERQGGPFLVTGPGRVGADSKTAETWGTGPRYVPP